MDGLQQRVHMQLKKGALRVDSDMDAVLGALCIWACRAIM